MYVFFTRFECSFVNIFFTRFECSFVNILFTRFEYSFVNIFFTRFECSLAHSGDVESVCWINNRQLISAALDKYVYVNVHSKRVENC